MGQAALRNHNLLSLSVVVALGTVSVTSCTHVEMDLNVPTGGVLEDAILITSSGGAAPREAKALGDVDLTQATLSFAHDLNATTSTHWWVIGHRSGEVVYTSNASLAGVDLYAVEPYDIATPLSWDIPVNLDAWVNGGTYSLDWWAATVTRHTSHVAADTTSATLWTFGTTGVDIGTLTLRLHVP